MKDNNDRERMNDWRNDPNVREALQERPPEEVALLECPHCRRLGYYNEGSHFSCRFCERHYYAMTAEEIAEAGQHDMLSSAVVCCDELMTVADALEGEARDAAAPLRKG